MDPDVIPPSLTSSGPSRLSVSSPGRLLLRPDPEQRDDLDYDLVSPTALRSHVRRESYSSSLANAPLLDAIGEPVGAQFGDESDRQLFTPPVGSQSTVRRIVRDDGLSGHSRQHSKGNASAVIEHAGPVFQLPTSASRYSPPLGANRRETVLNTSSTSIPMVDVSFNQLSAKYLSFFKRIIPNLGLVCILSTIWLVLLVYGEYAYPHSHSQFCNSYLPKESLMGRAVIITNPSITQLQLKSGFFDIFYNFRTSLDSFLSDFNMRRNYRILQQKCAPDAFIFTGTLVHSTSPESGSNDPAYMIDEEAYIRLYRRWDWIFTKTENSKFLFAPSALDIAFQSSMVSGNSETERRIMYQRFVDYFGPLNWSWQMGPFQLASLFSPALVAPSPAAPPQPMSTQRPSINAQLTLETSAFASKLEREAIEAGEDHRLILLSPQSFYLDDNSTCTDQDPIMPPHIRKNWEYTSLNRGVSTDLLRRLKPKSVLSRGALPGCTLQHSLANTLQTMMVSYSSRYQRPQVLVVEARNATIIESAGLSSLLSSYNGRLPTTALENSEPSSKRDNNTLPEIGSKKTPFELNTIFFDATTYTDMKGPYIWLFCLSVLGCMLSAEAGSGLTDFYATSTLIETTIAICRLTCRIGTTTYRQISQKGFSFKESFLEEQGQNSSEGEEPPHESPASASAAPSSLNMSGVVSAPQYSKRIYEVTKAGRIGRLVALRLQITVEVMLLCSVIVVPWCIFVMFRWM